MTWNEIQQAIPEDNPTPRARREAWMEGQVIYRGGFPMYTYEEGRLVKKVYPGFAKVVNTNPHLRLDCWKPTEEDLAATDWILL